MGVLRNRFNTLWPRQNGRHFADDMFKCIFLNKNASIALKISLKFVPKIRITNIPALVQIMAWRRPGDRPLSEPMMVCLLTHICVNRPQWVKKRQFSAFIYWSCQTRKALKPEFRILLFLSNVTSKPEVALLWNRISNLTPIQRFNMQSSSFEISWYSMVCAVLV